MIPMQVVENKCFIGRTGERKTLEQVGATTGAEILVVYGRRRVGKTELIEQTFAKRNLIKFEGLEGENKQHQIKQVLYQLSQYAQDIYLAKLELTTWVEVFDLLADKFAEGLWTLYFEELQWLANYDNELISALKYVWDNRFRHNPQLKIILCGSSPSFMINKVLHSKALYNRSLHEFHLREFSVAETALFFKNRAIREVMNAYLTIGGIPEYLRVIAKESSLFLGICKNSFKSESYFSHEYQRIFISSMSGSKYYQKTIEFLSKKRFATRNEIAKHLESSKGGSLTELLQDLTLCGFIEQYPSYQVDEASILVRYCICDNYLQFFYKFIKPKLREIRQGTFNTHFSELLKTDTYLKWLGYAFERYCRKNHKTIAEILGFSAVNYKVGPFFDRNTQTNDPGFQIDLVFDRADNVITICEIKYLQSAVDTTIIQDFEQKLKYFPNKKKKTIHKVLISAEGVTEALANRAYFDQIITLETLVTK